MGPFAVQNPLDIRLHPLHPSLVAQARLEKALRLEPYTYGHRWVAWELARRARVHWDRLKLFLPLIGESRPTDSTWPSPCANCGTPTLGKPRLSVTTIRERSATWRRISFPRPTDDDAAPPGKTWARTRLDEVFRHLLLPPVVLGDAARRWKPPLRHLDDYVVVHLRRGIAKNAVDDAVAPLLEYARVSRRDGRQPAWVARPHDLWGTGLRAVDAIDFLDGMIAGIELPELRRTLFSRPGRRPDSNRRTNDARLMHLEARLFDALTTNPLVTLIAPAS